MYTHYRAPNEPEELNQLRLPLLGPLYEREPWKPEVYPDYLAPIVRAAGDDAEAVLANLGMIPSASAAGQTLHDGQCQIGKRWARRRPIARPGAASAASFPHPEIYESYSLII